MLILLLYTSWGGNGVMERRTEKKKKKWRSSPLMYLFITAWQRWWQSSSDFLTVQSCRRLSALITVFISSAALWTAPLRLSVNFCDSKQQRCVFLSSQSLTPSGKQSDSPINSKYTNTPSGHRTCQSRTNWLAVVCVKARRRRRAEASLHVSLFVGGLSCQRIVFHDEVVTLRSLVTSVLMRWINHQIYCNC